MMRLVTVRSSWQRLVPRTRLTTTNTPTGTTTPPGRIDRSLFSSWRMPHGIHGSSVSICSLFTRQQQSNHDGTHTFMPLAAIAAAALVGNILTNDSSEHVYIRPFHDSHRSLCEASSTPPTIPSETTTPETTLTTTRTEWIGVSEDDVDALVELLMADTSINMAMVPDRIEAQLYKTTILLTLNAIYYFLVKGLHGTKILSHELQIKIQKRPNGEIKTGGDGGDTITHTPSSWLVQAVAESTRQPINDQVLYQVSQRLLANNSLVNSSWMPDGLEGQIYTACLQVIFRVTRIVLSTIKIQLCGHDIQLSLIFDDQQQQQQQKQHQDILEQAALRSVNRPPQSSLSPQAPRMTRMTPVDLELLKQMARRSCAVQQNVKNSDSSSSSPWWNRVFRTNTNNIRNNSYFLEQLHISLYGFILGLLDDLLLGELKVQFLSDTIAFDLVPSTFVEAARAPPKAKGMNGSSSSTTSSSKPPAVPVLMIASFLVGVGTGVLAVVSGNGTRSS